MIVRRIMSKTVEVKKKLKCFISKMKVNLIAMSLWFSLSFQTAILQWLSSLQFQVSHL
uniref:Uncharacterized protein n=1 Tax=Rhizophora mucronata TaxID=61149 RepID=A0A2P2NIY5_RHIMU